MNAQKLRNSCARLVEAREHAKQVTRVTLLRLEQTVARALEGETLRGLPNLMPDGAPFYARRLHGRFDAPLPRDGSFVLVLLRTGAIAWARWTSMRLAEWKFAIDDPALRVEDFMAYVRALDAALEENTKRADRTARNYREMAALAERIGEALRF